MKGKYQDVIKFYNLLYYRFSQPQHGLSVHINIDRGSTLNTPIQINGDYACNHDSDVCPITYSWSVVGPESSPTGYGLPIPSTVFEPFATGLYSIKIDVKCGETYCGSCKFKLKLQVVDWYRHPWRKLLSEEGEFFTVTVKKPLLLASRYIVNPILDT